MVWKTKTLHEPYSMRLQAPFSEWFQRSHAVSADGAPKMVFHGTSASFDTFNKSKQIMMGRFRGRPGFFFTSSAIEAEVSSEWAEIYRGGNRNIVPVYLRLLNPIVRKAQGYPQKWYDANWTALSEQAARNGNDGLIINGSGVGEGRTTYVVFEPEQIVSAIDARRAMTPVLTLVHGSANKAPDQVIKRRRHP